MTSSSEEPSPSEMESIKDDETEGEVSSPDVI